MLCGLPGEPVEKHSMIRFLIGAGVGISLATDKPETGAAALLFILAMAAAFCFLELESCHRDLHLNNSDGVPYPPGKPSKPRPGRN